MAIETAKDISISLNPAWIAYGASTVVGYMFIKIFSSDGSIGYSGSGTLVKILPFTPYLVDNPPKDIPIAIPYEVGNMDIGQCHVYVIYSLRTDGTFQVEKYGMTCQDDMNENISAENPRP